MWMDNSPKDFKSRAIPYGPQDGPKVSKDEHSQLFLRLASSGIQLKAGLLVEFALFLLQMFSISAQRKEHI